MAHLEPDKRTTARRNAFYNGQIHRYCTVLAPTRLIFNFAS